MAIVLREGQVTRHENEGNLGDGVSRGRPVHSCQADVHAEIRRTASELRPVLRAFSVQPDFSGKFPPQIRHARVLVRSGRCAEALDELQGLKALFKGSTLEPRRRASSNGSTSLRKGARPTSVREPRRERGAIRSGSGIFQRTPRRAARIAAALAALMVSVVLVVLAPAASAQPTFLDLGTLGGTSSHARGINDAGQVAGNSTTASGVEHAFLWTPGGTDGVPTNPQMKDLGTLGGASSHAWEMNDVGQVVGMSETGAGESHAFLWQNGVMSDLGTLGGTVSFARGINNLGQVVGQSANASGNQHAFLWTSGGTDGVPTNPQMKDLGSLVTPCRPGTVCSIATDINDVGQVVGLDFPSRFHAFLWQNGVMADLNTVMGLSFSYALGINDAGQVVGAGEFTSPIRFDAFLWQSGTPTDLGTLGGSACLTCASEAQSINTAGQVVGLSAPSDLQLDFSPAARPFLWQNGLMTDLGTLGGGGGLATDVNNVGQVGGSSQTASGQFHATVWTVATPAQATGALIDQVQGLVSAGVLNHGQGQSLTAKLNAALTRMSTNPCTAIHVLNAFVKEVNDYIATGLLMAAQGQPLLDSATAIIAQLEATASCS